MTCRQRFPNKKQIIFVKCSGTSAYCASYGAFNLQGTCIEHYDSKQFLSTQRLKSSHSISLQYISGLVVFCHTHPTHTCTCNLAKSPYGPCTCTCRKRVLLFYMPIIYVTRRHIHVHVHVYNHVHVSRWHLHVYMYVYMDFTTRLLKIYNVHM